MVAHVVVWAQREDDLRVDISCAQLLGDQELVHGLVDGGEDVGGRDDLGGGGSSCQRETGRAGE